MSLELLETILAWLGLIIVSISTIIVVSLLLLRFIVIQLTEISVFASKIKSKEVKEDESTDN